MCVRVFVGGGLLFAPHEMLKRCVKMSGGVQTDADILKRHYRAAGMHHCVGNYQNTMFSYRMCYIEQNTHTVGAIII